MTDTKTVLPTEVARGVYIEKSPSAQALKLMHLLIAQAGGRMAEDVQHELRLAEIKKIDGMRNHTRATLRELFSELRAAILIHGDKEKMRLTIDGLIDRAQIDYREESTTGDLAVSWWFSGQNLQGNRRRFDTLDGHGPPDRLCAAPRNIQFICSSTSPVWCVWMTSPANASLCRNCGRCLVSRKARW